MAKKSRRQLMKEALLKRTEESDKRKEDSGKFGSYFQKGLSDVTFWKCKEGDHMLDIIPYEAGPNDPNTKEGEYAYVLDLWVHYGIGVNEDQYICLARSYGKKCPICEHQTKLMEEEDYDEDMVKSLNPKRRTSYNILCYDNDKEEDKGVQVFEVAHWFIENTLAEIARNIKTGEIEAFADPDDGKMLVFKRKGTGKNNTKYVGHRLEDRDDYVIDDADLDSAHCLDKLIHKPDYDEVYEAYWGEFTDSNEKEEEKPKEEEKVSNKSSRRNRRPKKEEPKKSESGCPHNLRFGEDLYVDPTPPECDSCEVWDACQIRSQELENKKEEEKPKEEEKKKITGRRRRRN